MNCLLLSAELVGHILDFALCLGGLGSPLPKNELDMERIGLCGAGVLGAGRVARTWLAALGHITALHFHMRSLTLEGSPRLSREALGGDLLAKLLRRLPRLAVVNLHMYGYGLTGNGVKSAMSAVGELREIKDLHLHFGANHIGDLGGACRGCLSCSVA